MPRCSGPPRNMAWARALVGARNAAATAAMIFVLDTVVPRLAGGELIPKVRLGASVGLEEDCWTPVAPRVPEGSRASVLCGGRAWDVELCHGFHGEHHGNRTRRTAVTSNRR